MASLTKPNATSTPAVKEVPRPKLLVGEADITKGIKSAHGRGQSLQKDLHILACSVMAHIEQHRSNGVNANLANALVQALPDGMRKNALLDWFCAHAAVSYNEETQKLMFDKDQKTHQIAGEQKPFWSFKPEPTYKVYNFQEALAAFLKTANQHKVKANALDTLPTNAALDALAALAAIAVPPGTVQAPQIDILAQ